MLVCLPTKLLFKCYCLRYMYDLALSKYCTATAFITFKSC